MSSVRYALLSLLVREPLSGYDLTRQLSTRLEPIWPVRYNQVYPELARMREEGLVQYAVVESESYRPNKKIYEVTPAGREALRAWVLQKSEPTVTRDEFFLRVYDLWLVEPAEGIRLIREQRAQHQQQIAFYEAHREELRAQVDPADHLMRDPLSTTIASLTIGLNFERQYIASCDELLAALGASPEDSDETDFV